ncbi:hypothetical protein NC652_032360 [Populus alba x Populus x berolinensis]|nr:hypothetical protein NC652_032360 [Populus alba x Populus x berolinensis]
MVVDTATYSLLSDGGSFINSVNGFCNFRNRWHYFEKCSRHGNWEFVNHRCLPVVSSLIYIEERRNMELIPLELRKMRKERELHDLVLLSPHFADTTVALGVLLNNLGEVTKDMGRRRALNADTELAAFWAPFLILYLGPTYSEFMEELTLKQYEGFHVTASEVMEAQRRKHLRWSNSLAQHSLLSFCLKSMSNGAVSDIPWSCKGQARRAIETLYLYLEKEERRPNRRRRRGEKEKAQPRGKGEKERRKDSRPKKERRGREEEDRKPNKLNRAGSRRK